MMLGSENGAIRADGSPKGLREIGHLAAWSVTSAKPGNGVELLRDGRSDTFWQSDGLQPHLINIQFQRKVLISEVQLYLDFKLDESYTPRTVSLRAGTGLHDLKEIRVVELEEPCGWMSLPLGVAAASAADAAGGAAADDSAAAAPLRTFFLQLAILSNHQQGRDSHLRGVRVFGPRVDPARALLGLPLAITSNEMAAYATIR